MSGDTMMPGQCVTDEALTGYLEGTLDPVVKAACEIHLVACDRCRERLAMFMQVLQTEITPDEEAAVQAIFSVWESRKGGMGPSRQARMGNLRSWLLFIAAVAAFSAIVFVLVWMPANRPRMPRSSGEVIELLLSQDRPFEARLSGQPHRLLVQTRGGNGSNIDYGILAGEMSRLSANPYDMGRFYLLQQELDLAIRNLEIAAQDPASPAELHNDLGVAYMERGGDVNLKKAEDEFRLVLRRNANFAPAVFNLSLVYERMGALPAAEAEWKRYLQLDSGSKWAEEIRLKLQAISR